MAARRKARSKRPGPQPKRAWTDAARAERGYGRITLRMPQDTLDKLESLAERLGETRAALVDSYICQDWDDHVAIDGRLATGGEGEE